MVGEHSQKDVMKGKKRNLEVTLVDGPFAGRSMQVAEDVYCTQIANSMYVPTLVREWDLSLGLSRSMWSWLGDYKIERQAPNTWLMSQVSSVYGDDTTLTENMIAKFINVLLAQSIDLRNQQEHGCT